MMMNQSTDGTDAAAATAAASMAFLFDEQGTSARDRFLLMLIDRVQAVEGAVASLEAGASTESMSVRLDFGSIVGRVFGGSAGLAPDWAAFAARFGHEVQRLGGVDLSEVIVQRVRAQNTPSIPVDLGEMMQSMLESATTETFLTVRLRTKQPTGAVQLKLVQALDAIGTVSAIGAWQTTAVHAARKAAVQGAETWTWRVSRSADQSYESAHESAPEPKQKQPEPTWAASVGFASALMAAMRTGP